MDILVIGSLNMDLGIMTERIPRIGETVRGEGFFTTPGGKGANQAAAAAKLGGSVAMLGCVGNDAFGLQLMDSLRQSGVDTSHILRHEMLPTGVAMILVERGDCIAPGDNCIVIAPGANGALSPEDIRRNAALFAQCKVVVLQLEIPLETVRAAMRLAKAYGKTVLLNPAPAVPLDDEILAMADILTPNESECEALTGLPVRNKEEALAAAQVLRERGAAKVIVTLGGKGLVYAGPEGTAHLPARPVQVADTTAAGDCFMGALAAALAGGKTIEQSLPFARDAAALAVTRKGAQASLPALEDVIGFLLPTA